MSYASVYFPKRMGKSPWILSWRSALWSTVLPLHFPFVQELKKKKKHFSLFQLQMNFNAQQSKQKSIKRCIQCENAFIVLAISGERTNERRKAMHTNLAFFFVCSARRFDERWLRMRFIYELKNKSRLCWPFISIWLIYLKLIVWRNLHRAWQTNR